MCLSTLTLYAKSDAVILVYHHVSTKTPRSTSVSPNTFKKHLNYLEDNEFKVLPLNTILTAIAQKQDLPNKSVAITFDDAYESILSEALPLLRQKNYPFTVFVNTQSITASYKNILSWNELKILQNHKGTIGNHTHSHTHMVRRLKDETKIQWKNRIETDILRAKVLLEKHLGVTNKLFAYPYGEYNEEVMDILDSLGYVGLAQQSGAVGVGFNKLEIPRFPMATKYSDMKRFSTSVNTKLLPLKNVQIGSKVLKSDETGNHSFSFELKEGNYRVNQLACYASSIGKLPIKVQDGKVQMQLPLWGAGRKKINCTAPSKTQKGVFYWYSQLWLVKNNDGSWYRE